MKQFYIYYDCVQLSVDHLNNCRENLAAAERNQIRFLFAANAAHLALVSSLTAVLTQYNRCGAFNSETAKKYSQITEKIEGGFKEYRVRLRKEEEKFLDEKEKLLPHLDLRVNSLVKLIESAKHVPNSASRHGLPLTLTTEEEKMIYQLTFIRDQVEHPKPPGLWSFTSDYVMEPIIVAVKLASKLIDKIEALEDYNRKQAVEVAGAIEQTCIRLMSGKA